MPEDIRCEKEAKEFVKQIDFLSEMRALSFSDKLYCQFAGENLSKDLQNGAKESCNHLGKDKELLIRAQNNIDIALKMLLDCMKKIEGNPCRG